MDTTTEAARICEQQRRMRRRDDGPGELVRMTEALAEEDEPKDLTMTTKALAEEAEETARLSERLQQWRRRCVYGSRELTTTTVLSVKENGPEDSETTTEAL